MKKTKKSYRAEVAQRIAKISVDDINPGDRWSIEKQEEVLGLRKGDPNYGFGVMALVAYIMRARREIGKPLAIWHEHWEMCFGDNDALQLKKVQSYDRRARKTKRKALTYGALLEEGKFSKEDWQKVVAGQEKRALQMLILESRDPIKIISQGAEKTDTSGAKQLMRSR